MFDNWRLKLVVENRFGNFSHPCGVQRFELRHAAAQHNNVGIKHINDIGQRAPE